MIFKNRKFYFFKNLLLADSRLIPRVGLISKRTLFILFWFSHPAYALRDPTMPPTSWREHPIVHVNVINLQGIFQDGRHIHAMLNGVLVDTGDRYQQWVVKNIQSDRVVLENKAGEINVIYLSESVKTPVASTIQKGTSL